MPQPLAPITNDGSSHVTINSIDADCQITDHRHRFVAQRGRSVTLCSEPFGTGFKGEVSHVVAFTFQEMTGDDTISGYLASNPFDVACVWGLAADCDVTGDYDFPDTGLSKVGGAALNFGDGVAISNGAYVIGWDEGDGGS